MHESNLIETIGSPPHSRQPRFAALYVLMFGIGALLLTRSFYLQILQGSALYAAAEGNRVTQTPVTAPRGIIYDQSAHQLVENIASTDLVLDPTLLPARDFEETLIEQLPKYSAIPPEELQRLITQTRRTQRVVVVRRALDHDTVLKIEEAQHLLPGVRLASSLVRQYPHNRTAAHVIGYTGPVTAEETTDQTHFLPTDITGKTGLEKMYDQTLRGRAGIHFQEVSADGQLQKDMGKQPPVPGRDLYLTLDIELQEYIHQLFQDRGDASAGAVVAMNPRTGGIVALMSYPSFDPNLFSQPALTSGAAELFKNENEPLFNRAINGSYPPGSTIKPLLAAAGLEEGVITPTTTVVSTGGITVGPWSFPDWKAGGHGVTDVKKAIAESVNTFFYLLTGGDETKAGLGVKRSTDYLKKFGWGAPTGIDLPGEASGFLPSPEWKEAVKEERWYVGDTYHLGIGQGDVTATPLQIAAATAAVANGGNWHTPHLVEKVAAPQQDPRLASYKSHRLPIKATHLRVVQEGMRQTVTEGSGRSLLDLSVALAGKTGTAQIGGTDATHAWFTSFGPYESPELVLTVLLEKGGEGDRDAVPFAKNIWKWWIDHRQNN